jgi:hypothetical protein
VYRIAAMIEFRFVVRWVCSQALVFALLGVSTSATAREARLMVIPLESYLGTQTPVRLNVGGHEGLFLFDTGEGVSTITPQFAAAIGCTPWDQVTVATLRGYPLHIG